MTTIIQQIRQLRKRQGVTQRKLAQMSGYSRSEIQRWECSVHEPRACALLELAQALGYDLVLRPRI